MKKKRAIGFLSDDKPQKETDSPESALTLAITHVINTYIMCDTLQDSDFVNTETLMNEFEDLIGKQPNKIDFFKAMEKEGYRYNSIDGVGIVWQLKRK
jgi:hypothetical protein